MRGGGGGNPKKFFKPIGKQFGLKKTVGGGGGRGVGGSHPDP